MAEPSSNGWTQYEKLVMSSLATLADQQKETQHEVGKITTAVAVIQHSLDQTGGYDERLTALEQNAVTEESLRKERRWIYGAAFAVVASIIVPILLVVSSSGGF